MNVLPKMALPITGACSCGRFTYSCSKAPIWSVNCHCHSCQKASGAPFVSAFSIPADGFAWHGETLSFRRLAEAGAIVTTAHCRDCGSRVFAQSESATHLVNVFASTLSDPSGFVAISNVYLSEAAPWIEPPKAKFNFPGMPKA